MKELEAALSQLPMQSLAALPPNHDVRHIVRQILYLAVESSDRHRTPLLMSQKIVQLLYKTTQQLTREVYVALLDQLCRTFEDVAKEAITWLIYADDEVRSYFSRYLQYSQKRLCSEKTQCACDRHTTPERFDQHCPARSATSKVLVR